jgi:hypothetical protein
MPIQNFDFPGVAFHQTFDTAPATTLSMLGVACVGTQYQLHKVDSADACELVGYTYDPDNATTATVQATPGGSIDTNQATQHLVVKNGAFRFATFESAKIDAAHTTTATGVITFTEPIADGYGAEADADFGSRGVRVGDPIRLTGNGGTVLTTVLRIDPVTGIGPAQIVVGDTGELTTVTKAEFCVPLDITYEAGSGTFTLTDAASDNLSIKGGLSAKLDAFAGRDCPLLGGDFFIEFRESVQQYVNKLGIISTVSEITELLGTPCKDNPLALAVLFAFNTAGNVVYFTGVRAETPEAYDEALDFLAKYDGIYSIVPVTEDASIIKQCLTTCTLQSTDEESTIRRVVWYGITGSGTPTVWTGTGTFETSGSTVTVTLDSQPFTSTARRVGDKLKMVNAPYTTWLITGASGATVTLAAGSVAPASGSDVELEIIRTAPTNIEIVEDVNARRCTQSERAVCVWADGLQYNGEDLPNIYLAAAAAGMRCYEAPHRPLSNLGYNFFTLAEPFGMTKNQLKRIGANGIWIIANNQDGTPINMRQVTTAIANNINLDEESVIANADTIAMVVCWTGRSYVGNSNISPTLIALLEDDLRTAMDAFLKNASGNPYVGPQLLDWELLDLYQDAVNQDHVYANFECQPPRPFNKFVMNMRII